MSPKHLLVVAAAGVAVLLLGALAVFTYWDAWESRQPVFQNAPRLLAALQAFSRDQEAGGRPVPPEVSLKDLVRQGYLTPSDVRALAGMDVTLSTRRDDNDPQRILVSARLPDGEILCLLGDGSVHQFSREGYEQYQTNLAQRAANTAPPPPSETNLTPSAPAPDR